MSAHAVSPSFAHPGLLRVGVLANELFDPKLGRSGGFGWAAREAGRALQRQREIETSVVFLHGERSSFGVLPEAALDDRPVLYTRRGPVSRLITRLRFPLDVILTIDFRPSYLKQLNQFANAGVIVWARDPRTAREQETILTLRVPGFEKPPMNRYSIDCSELAAYASREAARGRRIVIASKTPEIREKCAEVYGMDSRLCLPNPSFRDYSAPLRPKATRPTVVFLGRLDPVKRPWIVHEIAKQLPDVDFVVAGRAQAGSSETWHPPVALPNVTYLGQVDGAEKSRVLESAWILLNTSVYEETPVSMFEALSVGVPVVSCLDTGNLAPRFGRFVGHHAGDGLSSVPAFVQAIAELVAEHQLRERLGALGRSFVTSQHNDQEFMQAFLRGVAMVT